MSSNPPDSDELKAKYAEIALLKKKIEEKKMNKYSSTPFSASYGVRGGYRSRARGRDTVGVGGRKQGIYGGIPTSFNSRRNLTVVFNNSRTDNSSQETQASQTESTLDDPKYVSTVSRGGLSLVSAEIFEKDIEKMNKKADEINILKEKLNQQKRLHAMKNRISRYRTKTDDCDRVRIDGDIFAVTRNGNKLYPLTVPVGNKSKIVTWNRKQYQRKHNGTLKCQLNRNSRVPIDVCRYFSRTAPGLCQKGSNCKYSHDQSHIRICRQSLMNNCYNKQCLFSHKLNEYNTPLCRFFLENKCVNSSCNFQHFKPEHYDDDNYEIWTCRPFAIGGWCGRGSKCPFLHLLNCPDFEEKNICPRGKSCTLAHPVTLRTQQLMASTNNKYERNESQDVLVESDGESTEKNIVSSYTVDPEILFITSKKGKYEFYVDNNGTSNSQNNYEEKNQFMIHLSDSDFEDEEVYSSEDSDIDDLQENNDYIEF